MKELSFKDSLFNRGRKIKLEKGEVLHDSHEKCCAIGMVEKGKLRLSRVLSSGKEIFLKEFLPGELFGELIVFTEENYPGWLIASEPSTIREVGKSRLQNYLMNQDSLITYLSGISRKMTHLTDTIEIMSLKTVKQKIAFFLLSPDNNKSDNIHYFKISHLAIKLGCSREAVSRALSELENEKTIVKGKGFIRIRDLDLLEQLF